MKILIILPNWLGDAIMATPAIENLIALHPKAKITFVGSFVSLEALKVHPNCQRAYIDKTKQTHNRLMATYLFAKKLGKHDIAITFRNNFYSTLLLRFTNSTCTIARQSLLATLLLKHAIDVKQQKHLTQKYNHLINTAFKKELPTKELKLFIPKKCFQKPILGLNPGATYGSAKKWFPERFAKVGAHFAKEFDIIIFGGPNEVDSAKEIEHELQNIGITNFQNLAGKTSVQELCAYIGGLSLFITNDSGPMHVGAAYQVPTVAIFGPTKHKETCQWLNEKSELVRHEVECGPCMKRECPLKHHKCMDLIQIEEVIQAAKRIL